LERNRGLAGLSSQPLARPAVARETVARPGVTEARVDRAPTAGANEDRACRYRPGLVIRDERFVPAEQVVRVLLAGLIGLGATVAGLATSVPHAVLSGMGGADVTGILATVAGIALVALAFWIALRGRRLMVKLAGGIIAVFVIAQWLIAPAINAGVATHAPRKAIQREMNPSPRIGSRCDPPSSRFVADMGHVAALPLSLSARPKRKPDRRRHEARSDLVVREWGSVGWSRARVLLAIASGRTR
jgi:hypothetical protein